MVSDVRMTGVKFLEDYRLEVYLTNGHEVIYNLQPKLVTARFKGIDEWERFSRGKIINGSRIVWEDNMELSLDEILTNITR